ncbi:MAG TPA: FAD-binding oxidoreductase [Thermoleophilaceae bacterium]
MSFPWPDSPPTPEQRAAYADAEPRPYWLANLPARDPYPPLTTTTDADLCIVGGGFTGLWAALHAKRENTWRDVVLLEKDTIGIGASGRNGGFVVSSLTHGIANGLSRFEDEMPELERLAAENFAGFKQDLRTHNIDCDFEETGELLAILEPYQEAWIEEEAELLNRFGHEYETFDATAMRQQLDSPLYRGGVWDKTGAGILDPGKLADGLREAAIRLGVRIYEGTKVEGLRDEGGHVEVLTAGGRIRARRVLLGTSAYRPLLRDMRRYIAPVYDYALVTEPIDVETTLGWKNRQGVGDGANQFHYYRLTKDNRILFGGYEAVYRFGGQVKPKYDVDDHTFGLLSQHFFTTFPQLEGTKFTHKWGGAIDTCSRFSVFFGTAHEGKTAYAVGYTGLGVAATRFGAQIGLELLAGKERELKYVRQKPVPFPPEPLKTAAIQLTRNRLAKADRNQGKRGIWLRTLDRLGLGFDS